jgi:hypothetical protein
MSDQMKLAISYLIPGTWKIERRSGYLSEAKNLFVKLLSSLEVCYGNAYVMQGFDDKYFPLFSDTCTFEAYSAAAIASTSNFHFDSRSWQQITVNAG